jgi:hypothetical protein
MVALKFLESHTHRDQIVLMIIAYFLVFASLLYERTLLILLYLLGFVWVTTAGLLQLGRHGVLLPSWPTAKLAARLLLQSVPIMLILFLLFPRLPGPLWAMPGDTSSGTSGLSESGRHNEPRLVGRSGFPRRIRDHTSERRRPILAGAGAIRLQRTDLDAKPRHASASDQNARIRGSAGRIPGQAPKQRAELAVCARHAGNLVY